MFLSLKLYCQFLAMYWKYNIYILTNQKKRYFKDNGSPDAVIKSLSENFKGYSQASLLLVKWLLDLGSEEDEIKEIIDAELSTLLYKIFDPANAELLLTDSYKSTVNTLMKIKFSSQLSNTFRNLQVRFPSSKFLQLLNESQENLNEKDHEQKLGFFSPDTVSSNLKDEEISKNAKPIEESVISKKIQNINRRK